MKNSFKESHLSEIYGLLIIDVQERIINPIENKELIVSNIETLLEAYQLLGDKIYISEQNPSKLGTTLNNLIPKTNFEIFEKMNFSVAKDEKLIQALKNDKIKNLIICGFETHICIQQSVLDLLNQNLNIYIVTDAMSSRKYTDHNISIKRMISKGAILTTTESIIFEMCETASRQEFKAISNIIKKRSHK